MHSALSCIVLAVMTRSLVISRYISVTINHLSICCCSGFIHQEHSRLTLTVYLREAQKIIRRTGWISNRDPVAPEYKGHMPHAVIWYLKPQTDKDTNLKILCMGKNESKAFET
jgi:hypothetical protein